LSLQRPPASPFRLRRRVGLHAREVDAATFGLWEVVGIPAETLADGTDVQVEVHYDAQQNVKDVVVIKGEKAVNPPKLFAHKPREKHKPSRAQDLAPATNPAIASDPATITDETAVLQ
jgi:hypothetical protein